MYGNVVCGARGCYQDARIVSEGRVVALRVREWLVGQEMRQCGGIGVWDMVRSVGTKKIPPMIRRDAEVLCE